LWGRGAKSSKEERRKGEKWLRVQKCEGEKGARSSKEERRKGGNWLRVQKRVKEKKRSYVNV
jgi:hypothetical protein